MDYIYSHLPTLYLVLEWSLRLVALFVVPRRRSPTSGTAWLLVIFLLTIPGWIAFLLLGNFKLPKDRRDIQKHINSDIDTRIAGIKKTDKNGDKIIDPLIPRKYRSLESLTQEYGRMPSLAANSIDIIHDYEGAIDSIIADINQAQDFVHLEYFTLALDAATEPLFAAMEAAQARGVDIKVLYDGWGSLRYPRRREMRRRLRAANIPFHAMLPLKLPGKHYVRPDLRNHRKIVIIDDRIGYTGSQNLVNRSYNRKDKIIYDELVVRISGPIVFELSAIFATDWLSEGGTFKARAVTMQTSNTQYDFPGAIMQLLPSGPGFTDENNLKVFTHLFHLADRSITVVNPYFVPPDSLLSALVSAAHRGVKVQMINSRAIDQWMVGYAQRSFYDTLLEAGVELYLYHPPTLLHSKFIVVDNEVVVVGSSNMDMRSFELDSELSLLCYDETIAAAMSRIAAKYVEKSSRLSRRQWQKRPLYKQLLENVARLTSSVQ